MTKPELEKYIVDLERRIDPGEEERLLAMWKSFWEGGLEEGIFLPAREAHNPPGLDWPEVSINQAFYSPEMMALQQLKMCSDILASGGGALLGLRCNYGTGILPSVFGAELFMMDEELNTLPTSRPIGGDMERLIDSGIPDVGSGLGSRVFETAGFLKDTLRNYPNLKRCSFLYHPDIQGPMDVCELLWGGELFMALADTPDLVHSLLSVVTGTYKRFMAEWLKYAPQPGEFSVHWGMLMRGGVMLRDDSAMNLSPAMFEEFIKPYDEDILGAFGGGALHFCGRGGHFIGKASEMTGLYAVNISQPELNDMAEIFEHTLEKGIKIIGFNKDFAEKLLKESGRHSFKNLQCFSNPAGLFGF